MKGDEQDCTVGLGAGEDCRTKSGFYLIAHFKKVFSVMLKLVD